MSCETNINDCLSAPCHRGECIDGDNSFTCNCHPGYTGRVCQTQINECESNPCQFGGECGNKFSDRKPSEPLLEFSGEFRGREKEGKKG